VKFWYEYPLEIIPAKAVNECRVANIQKILFVDDEPSVLSAMHRLFHDDACEVMRPVGGPVALELLRENGPVQLVT
jgi:CheY-like chemotaxis protein